MSLKVGFIGAVTALFFLLGAAAQVSASEKIRLSVTNANMSFLPAGVAMKKGFLKGEGFEAEVIRMNVPNAITALMTGDVNYTLIFGSVVRGALRGMPVPPKFPMPMRLLSEISDRVTKQLLADIVAKLPVYKCARLTTCPHVIGVRS
jgi:hypothetical protein